MAALLYAVLTALLVAPKGEAEDIEEAEKLGTAEEGKE